jgi:hypothetical protein
MANIRPFIPQHFVTGEKTTLAAILKSVEDSSSRLEQMIEAGVDQNFLATATGKYLLYLGEQEGFSMPTNSGLDIRALRLLVPAMVAYPKQVSITLNKLLEIFYTTDKLKPSVTASFQEPYSIESGDNLIITTDSATVEISILETQVGDISNVSAQELAGVINSQQDVYVASVFTDLKTNLKYLRIGPKTFGPGAFIRVSGGSLQNTLKFPKIVPTNIAVGSQWLVTKPAPYSDLTTFKWNGLGTNPLLYKVALRDVVTIKGFIGAEGELNGSFIVEDVGYDYFIVRNRKLSTDNLPISLAEEDQIVFTSQDKLGLYDQEEYGLLTETGPVTTTVTIPAIPPLARRFLSGSSHIHGAELPVLDFTRSSITVDTSFGEIAPDKQNLIVISNPNLRPNFSISNQIPSVDSDLGIVRSYLLDISNPDYGVLPFTTIAPTGTNTIYGEPDDDFLTLNFPNFSHGLNATWGFNISAANGAGNISLLQLNQEHIVESVPSRNKIIFKIFNGPVAVRFSGVSTGTFDVYRHSTVQVDESDFYFQFPSPAAVLASGLTVGAVVKLDNMTGTDIEPYFPDRLRYAKMIVKSISGNIVNVFTGFDVGVGGLVISGVNGRRAAHFGGQVNYYLEKTSPHNEAVVMRDLSACFMSYTPSVNENYVGSFLYDPIGEYTPYTVSGTLAKTTEPVLKGDSPISLVVSSVDGWPTNGYLIVDYGTDKQEGPIFFQSIINNNSGDSQIILDPAYRFKKSHFENAQVQYIHKLAPFAPGGDGKDFPIYITGTANARNTLKELLKLIVAVGVFLEFNVLFPSLKYRDPAIDPYE